jgi:hypothetical protein
MLKGMTNEEPLIRQYQQESRPDLAFSGADEAGDAARMKTAQKPVAKEKREFSVPAMNN